MKQDLINKAPQLLSIFGGVDSFVDLVSKHTNKNEIFYKLLSHQDSVFGITPFNLVFSLTSEVFGQTKVDQEPYHVFDIKGNLLYSSTAYANIFGLSILDKALLLDSKTLDMFYLSYKVLKGYKNILLVINKNTSAPRQISFNETSFDNSRITNAIESNQILFVTDDVYIDSQTTRPYPINISYLNSSTPSTPSNILNSPNTITTVFDSNLFNSFLFVPPSSGWIIIHQDTPEGIKYLQATPVLGKGADRFIKYSNEINYVTLSYDNSSVEINSILSNSNRTLSSIDNVIDLRVELSK
jgi:hypothetical protein